MQRRTGVKLCWVLVLLAVSLLTAGFPGQAEACCACGNHFCVGNCYNSYPEGPGRDACLQDCYEWEEYCLTHCPGPIC